MTFEEFRSAATEPSEVDAALRALWQDARGDWEEAHCIAQDVDTDAAAWVHAYLHRKEGDLPNARYWYHRARRPVATGSLDAEWESMVRTLLRSG